MQQSRVGSGSGLSKRNPNFEINFLQSRHSDRMSAIERDVLRKSSGSCRWAIPASWQPNCIGWSTSQRSVTAARMVPKEDIWSHQLFVCRPCLVLPETRRGESLAMSLRHRNFNDLLPQQSVVQRILNMQKLEALGGYSRRSPSAALPLGHESPEM